MENTEFTGTTKAWISSPSYREISDVLELLKEGEPDKAIGYLAYSNHDMSTSGWVEVGTATITVNLCNNDTVTVKQIAAMHQELQNVRAENQMRENFILERISKLQALTYDATTVSEPASF